MNKIALVTGASRLQGIGAAVCRELGSSGYSVFFTSWTPFDQAVYQKNTTRDPDILLEELRTAGVQAEQMEADLSDPEVPEQIFLEVKNRLGAPPDILVNNAAFSVNKDILEMTALDLDRHYHVNVRGTALMCGAFARHFSKESGGRIINMTSGQSQGPMPGEIPYAVSKGAIDALTLSISAELAPMGITVNAVNPGPTDTGWMTREIKEQLTPLFPLGRPGQPADAARLIRFLASEDSAWITGQVLHSEGGFRR
ncbi:SDR family oxidoreductase [Bacillus mangrovi]|uniref:SDR family oxidoreductase n=1 Tax=Metabacillus mangrovi TaxID=1491830 RepID=A0A7X2S825_9BACI|nr:SDR family oxidoreductase [Metabacillus mangrovi]MTH55444.1 SDR family oxidoreductase [Metabacillus mangrovi]